MDVTDYSLDALVRHCDHLMKSGELSKPKARGWKTACRSLISPLAPDLQTDVRKVDVESAVNSYKGNNPDGVKRTITDYESRLKNALASFLEKAEKPVDFPSDTRSTSEPEKLMRKSPELPLPEAVKKTTSSHTLNIPLRPDFVAQLIIPYDIQHVEAKRILKVLEALAMSNEELDS